jgi:Cyclin, N-terminal domain/Cyclin, C-terminal domain
MIDYLSAQRSHASSFKSSSMKSSIKLEQMLDLETKSQMQKNCDATATSSFQYMPNEVWRDRVAQWCYDVADHLNENRAVVYVSMYILDRYCALQASSGNEIIDERTYEVASLSAFFLGVRLTGSNTLDVVDLTSMSRGQVTAQEIHSTGKAIVQGLHWNYRLLTPFDFVKTFVTLLCSDVSPIMLDVILNEAAYLCELSVSDFELTHTRASELALAAILNTLQTKLSHHIGRFCSVVEEAVGLIVQSDKVRGICARVTSVCTSNEAGARAQVPHLILADEDDSESEDSTSDYHVPSCPGLVLIVSSDDLNHMTIHAGSKRNLDEKSSHRKYKRTE